MSSISQLTKDLHDIITKSDDRKPKPYDTEATVLKVEGDTAWVKIPGGIDETPVRKTNNANVGDNVMIRVSGGRAWLLGNSTNPPTDDKVANEAIYISKEAGEQAGKAIDQANVAQAAAGIAVESAEIAYEAAMSAAEDAGLARQAADDAQKSAEGAQASADSALADAMRSTSYANDALGQLSEVEKVVDALNWISEHGQYAVTEDTEVILGKWYFVLQDGSYVLVTPDADSNPHALGYYELTSVDEAISNYVSTHLALTDDGLYVQIDDNACKLQITGTGINLYDPAGDIIASYSSSVVLGNPHSTHIHLSPTDGLGFYNGDEDPNDVNVNRVAYINGNKLYISQAEITTSLRIGRFLWKVQGANRISLIYSPTN